MNGDLRRNGRAARGIRGFRSARSSILEVIVVVGILAIAIGLLTSQIPRDLPAWIPVGAGIVLVIASLGYVWTSRLGGRAESFTTDMFFMVDRRTNELVDVPGYEFSEELCRFAKRAMSEQAPLKRQWTEDPLWRESTDQSRLVPMPGRTRGGRLIFELVEFMLVNELTLHLEGFFNKPEFDRDKLIDYGRDDVADVIQGNRILELFTRPLEDRNTSLASSPPDSTIAVIMAITEGEASYYTRFKLRLPKGSQVRRSGQAIAVSGPVFDLRLSVEFEGFATLLPRDFQRDYLKRSLVDVSAYSISVRVDTTMKRRAFFRRDGWTYFSWPDSFFDHLEREWSGEAFFNVIQWPTLRALAQMTRAADAIDESPAALETPSDPDL